MICFVSAPVGVDTRPVIDTLTLEGLNHIDAGSLQSGGSFTDAIRSAIASSDLVLVILPERGPDPPAFMIEVGMALGLAKHLLVVVPKSRQPPAVLSDVQCVRADVDDVEAIRLNVRAALKDLGAPKSRREDLAAPRPQRELASWLASMLAELPTDSHSAGVALERIVAELFRRAGGEVEPSPELRAGPDLAVLLDTPSTVNGVLLVEVKRVRGKTDLRNAMLQMQEFVLQRGAALGIVAYLNVGRTVQSPSPVPRIVAIDLTDLPQRLETQSLGEILSIERNRAVHGM
jgi:hypothetical protein